MKRGIVEVIKGNAIDYALENDASFFHIVNCRGKMGSGVAKEVKDRVPEAYNAYMACYNDCDLHLGTFTDFANFHNLAAQDSYGGNKRHLNYGALADCFATIKACDSLGIAELRETIVVPYRMGSDRGGGDWSIVVEMLEYYFHDYYLVACKL